MRTSRPTASWRKGSCFFTPNDPHQKHQCDEYVALEPFTWVLSASNSTGLTNDPCSRLNLLHVSLLSSTKLNLVSATRFCTTFNGAGLRVPIDRSMLKCVSNRCEKLCVCFFMGNRQSTPTSDHVHRPPPKTWTYMKKCRFGPAISQFSQSVSQSVSGVYRYTICWFLYNDWIADVKLG